MFARGGSKGLPGKNLKLINNISLVGKAIKDLKKIARIGSIYLSSDDDLIMEEGKIYGAIVPFKRPTELATDKSPEIHSWKHLLNYLEDEKGETYHYIVSIPPTAPLRDFSDIDRIIDRALETDADMVVSVVRSSKNPYFDMVRLDEDSNIIPIATDLAIFNRRQAAPKTYDIVPVAYVAKTEYILSVDHFFSGKVIGLEVEKLTGVDIDTEEDLLYATYLAGLKGNR